MHAILMRSQLRWGGHVHRMEGSRLPYGELSSGKRTVGRPKIHFKDTLKASLKHCDIPHSIWEETADDRPAWRSIVKNGVADFEERRIRDKKQKRKNGLCKIWGRQTKCIMGNMEVENLVFAAVSVKQYNVKPSAKINSGPLLQKLADVS